MAVIANVDADLADASFKDRVTHVIGPKVELLVKTWATLRNMHLAEFAEIRTIGIDHGGGVVIDAGQILLIHRYDQHDAMLLGDFHHEFDSWPVGDFFCQAVP